MCQPCMVAAFLSDKELTQRSGLMEKLQYGDVIMSDRGFNIHEMLAIKGVKVNLPPFMNESGQFSESELLEKKKDCISKNPC